MASKLSKKEDLSSTCQDVQNSEPTENPLSVAMILKNARLKKKANIQEVSSRLRISERYLTAIEENDLTKLPEQVYTLGFIRSYAEYLNLNPAEIVAQYKSENYPPAPGQVLSFPEIGLDTGKPKVWILLSAGTLAAIVASLWYFSNLPKNIDSNEVNDLDVLTQTSSTASSSSQIQSGREQGVLQKIEEDFKNTLNEEAAGEEAVKPQDDQQKLETENFQKPDEVELTKPEATQPLQNTSENQNQLIQDQAKTIEEPKEQSLTYKDLQFIPGDKFTVIATALSWLEVRDAQGEILISRNLAPGENVLFEARPGMKFSTGNAGGLKFILQDHTTVPLGKNGEILRDQSLHFKLNQ